MEDEPDSSQIVKNTEDMMRESLQTLEEEKLKGLEIMDQIETYNALFMDLQMKINELKEENHLLNSEQFMDELKYSQIIEDKNHFANIVEKHAAHEEEMKNESKQFPSFVKKGGERLQLIRLETNKVNDLMEKKKKEMLQAQETNREVQRKIEDLQMSHASKMDAEKEKIGKIEQENASLADEKKGLLITCNNIPPISILQTQLKDLNDESVITVSQMEELTEKIKSYDMEISENSIYDLKKELNEIEKEEQMLKTKCAQEEINSEKISVEYKKGVDTLKELFDVLKSKYGDALFNCQFDVDNIPKTTKNTKDALDFSFTTNEKEIAEETAAIETLKLSKRRQEQKLEFSKDNVLFLREQINSIESRLQSFRDSEERDKILSGKLEEAQEKLNSLTENRKKVREEAIADFEEKKKNLEESLEKAKCDWQELLVQNKKEVDQKRGVSEKRAKELREHLKHLTKIKRVFTNKFENCKITKEKLVNMVNMKRFMGE